MSGYNDIKDYQTKQHSNDYHPCNCMGPQNGQPACPCAMRHMKVIDGRWVIVQDFGPAKVDE